MRSEFLALERVEEWNLHFDPDQAGAPAAETRDGIAVRAISQAIAELKGAFGESPDTWIWERVQTAALARPPFGLPGVAPEGRLVLTPEGEE